jgi:hypothetical protein
MAPSQSCRAQPQCLPVLLEKDSGVTENPKFELPNPKRTREVSAIEETSLRHGWNSNFRIPCSFRHSPFELFLTDSTHAVDIATLHQFPQLL